MKLTPHFTLEEFVRSDKAKLHNIDNTPTDAIKANLQKLAEGLEKVRAVLGAPIIITSGYRNKAVNRLVGGVENSGHLTGLAADFVSPKFGTVAEICKAIKDSGLPVDQCINEYDKWVHVGFGSQMRNQHFKKSS